MIKKIVIVCVSLFLLIICFLVTHADIASEVETNESIELPSIKITAIEVVNGLTGQIKIISGQDKIVTIQNAICQKDSEAIGKEDHNRNGYWYHLIFMDDYGNEAYHLTINNADHVNYDGQTYNINTEAITALLQE